MSLFSIDDKLMIYCVKFNWILHLFGFIPTYSHVWLCFIAVRMKYKLPGTRSFFYFGDGTGRVFEEKKVRDGLGTGILSGPVNDWPFLGKQFILLTSLIISLKCMIIDAQKPCSVMKVCFHCSKANLESALAARSGLHVVHVKWHCRGSAGSS